MVRCLKSHISEGPSTSNMVNEPKRFSKLNDGPFAIFIGPCEYSWRLKRLSEWCAQFSDCLLTHWLPMTSILFLTDAIYCNIFRCNYLRNEKIFLNFVFLDFLNLDWILSIFEKKMTLIADLFLNLWTPKNLVG